MSPQAYSATGFWPVASLFHVYVDKLFESASPHYLKGTTTLLYYPTDEQLRAAVSATKMGRFLISITYLILGIRISDASTRAITMSRILLFVCHNDFSAALPPTDFAAENAAW